MAEAPAPRSADETPAGTPPEPPENYPDIVFIRNGTMHPLWVGELSGRDIALVRVQTGKSLQMIALEMHTGQGDLDTQAVYIWLSRRQQGEPQLRFDDVLDELTYGDDIELVTLELDRDRIVDLYPDGPPER